MICPKCELDQSKCINSRQVGKSRVRKYRCLQCGHKYDTIEVYKGKEVVADDRSD